MGETSNSLHPLQTSWTFWFDMPSDRKAAADWDEGLKNVFTFDSVEKFWRLFNNLASASKLPMGGNYYFFRVSLLAFENAYLASLEWYPPSLGGRTKHRGGTLAEYLFGQPGAAGSGMAQSGEDACCCAR
jgi:hypothetical protein